MTIVDAEQLGGVMIERLAELFDEDRGANTRVKSRRTTRAARCHCKLCTGRAADRPG